jgi:hypothetical protein
MTNVTCQARLSLRELNGDQGEKSRISDRELLSLLWCVIPKPGAVQPGEGSPVRAQPAPWIFFAPPETALRMAPSEEIQHNRTAAFIRIPLKHPPIKSSVDR